METTDLKALENEALAELEGLNSNSESSTSSLNNATEQDEVIEEEQENTEYEEEIEDDEVIEEEETIDKESLREEIKKEVERDLKKKYYSKLNQEQKKLREAQAELESLKADGYDDDQIDAVRKIVRSELQETNVSKIEKTEYSNFLKQNKSIDNIDLKGIKEIKADFPNMSWESARTFYLAQNKPEILVRPKPQDLSIKGGVPKSISNGPDLNDPNELYKQATEEANRYARGNY